MSSSHLHQQCLGDEDILQVFGPNDDIVEHMPMFRPWVLPGGFESVLLANDTVSNQKLMFQALG